MWEHRAKLRWAIFLCAIGILVVTHLLSYRRGVASEHSRVASSLEQIIGDSQGQAFDAHLDYLRLLAKHPNDVSREERLSACRKGKVLTDLVVASKLARYRELGDDQLTARWQEKISEARRLAAQLCPDGN